MPESDTSNNDSAAVADSDRVDPDGQAGRGRAAAEQEGGTGGGGTGGGGTGGGGTGGGGSGGTTQAPISDLQPTSVTGPGSPVTAGSVTLDWTVTNNGPGTTNSNYWDDDLWISTNATLSSGGTDVLLGSVQHTNPLAAGDGYSASATFTVPQGTAAGNYYFIVVTNATSLVYETDASNDSLASSTTTSVSPAPIPVFAVSNVTVPSTATSGGQLSVGWTVTNNGQDTGNVPITDSVYLSFDQVFDPTDRYLGSLNYQADLASGASYTQNATFSLPSGLAGTFYVFVETNSNGNLYEPDTASNTAFDPEPLQIQLPPVADLVAGAVSLPASAVDGQNITVTYQVTNDGGNPADGSWVDSLYLSSTPTWSVTDPLLGSVDQTQDIAPGGSYTATLTAPVPGVTPGSYYVILRTNILNTLPESTLGNNESASLTASSITAPTLTLGTPIDGTLAIGQAAYYGVDVAAGQTLQISFNTATSTAFNELYVSFGTMPTRTSHEFAFPSAGADQQITVPTTQAGLYYILAYGSSVPSPGESYTITASLVPFSITGVSPTQVGTGQATIEITGSKFDSGTTFELLGPAGTVDEQSADLQDSSTAFVTFNLGGMPTGTYDLQATQSDGATVVLLQGLNVVPAAPADVHVYLSVPNAVLVGEQGGISITYVNDGNTDALAPLMALIAEDAFLPLSVAEGGGTEGQVIAPVFAAAPLWFLGTSSTGPAGVLRPGERGVINIPFQTTGLVGQYIDFDVQLADDSQPMDWASQESALQLPTIPDAAWPAVFANLVANMGPTVATYHAALAADATYLGEIGEPTSDVPSLIAFELEKANAAFTTQTLDTVTDDSLPAPGMALTFQRSFQASIAGRYTEGLFGYGWTTNWDISATTDSSGNAVITNDGVTLYYTKEADGSYQPEAGDDSVVTFTNGAYRLVTTDGTIYQFNPNGTIGYVQDSKGNRITAGYNFAGQFVSLADSNGESLTLSYNAQSHLGTLTDSNGQTETYGYDPTGQFLTSYTDIYGTTLYTYVTGQSPAQNNALAEIAYSDNTHIYFAYDSQGRLIDQHRDNGQQDQTWTYLNPGGYTITDADGNTSTVYFDRFGAAAVTIDPLGNVTRNTYDANLNLIKSVGPSGTTYTYTYDANGNLTSETDPLGLTTTFTYNTRNDLTSYTDANGNATSYAYDSANDLLSIIYANGTQQSYTYNPLGEATQYLDARGQAIGYTYNAQGLVATETFADGTSYTFTYSPQGNLTSATDTQGVETFVYGASSNPDLLTEVDYPDGTWLKFSYNIVGQRTQSVDQTGFTVNYTYDALGRLSKLTDADDNLIVLYTYDAAGNLIQKDNGNGTRTVYTYDKDGDVLSITNYAPDHVSVNSFDDYTYDALGNVLTDTNQDGQWVYSYDADSQLVQAIFTPNNSDPDSLEAQDLQYVYDAVGNRISETVNGIRTIYQTNDVNEYTSSITDAITSTYQYDADGNLIAQTVGESTTTYTFNQINQLTAVNGLGMAASYGYDAARQPHRADDQRCDFVLPDRPGRFGQRRGHLRQR